MVISHRIGASFRIHLLILILQYYSVIILLVISYFPASALSASGSMGIISADLSAPRDIHLANILKISLSRIKRAAFQCILTDVDIHRLVSVSGFHKEMDNVHLLSPLFFSTSYDFSCQFQNKSVSLLLIYTDMEQCLTTEKVYTILT